jgi:hypothetical protein
MRTFLPEGAVAHVRRATRRRSFTLPPWRAGQRAAELVLCLIAQHGRPGRVRPFAIRVELVSCCALGVVIQVDAERRWHVEHHAWRLLRLVLDLKGCPRPVARAVEVTIEEGRLGGRAWLIAMSSGPSGRPVGLRGPASGPAALHYKRGVLLAGGRRRTVERPGSFCYAADRYCTPSIKFASLLCASKRRCKKKFYSIDSQTLAATAPLLTARESYHIHPCSTSVYVHSTRNSYRAHAHHDTRGAAWGAPGPRGRPEIFLTS